MPSNLSKVPFVLAICCFLSLPEHRFRRFRSTSEKRFYSVAVITSGSDRHHLCGVGHPGDPGSIPGRTSSFCFCSRHLAEDGGGTGGGYDRLK